MEHKHDNEHTHAAQESHATPVSNGTPAWLLPASILAAAVLISGSLIYMVHGGKGAVVAPTDPNAPTETSVQAEAPAAEDRDAILGQADAPVSIVAFEDFQCPFCAKYYDETESQIRAAYVETGKAKLVYRHLAFLGPESVAAAAASECAKDQGKFWEYHDAIFDAEMIDGQEHNGNLKRSLFMQLAKDIQLDETAFASCIDSKKYDDFVTQQTEDSGTKYGVNSTPTIFINDRKVEGAYPFSEFQQLIEEALNG